MASTVRKGQGAGAGAPSASLQASTTALKRSAKEARLAEPKPKRQRTKAGCITCRVRGKVSPRPLFPYFYLLFNGHLSPFAPMANPRGSGRSDR
jgi:hypothetical protein